MKPETAAWSRQRQHECQQWRVIFLEEPIKKHQNIFNLVVFVPNYMEFGDSGRKFPTCGATLTLSIRKIQKFDGIRRTGVHNTCKLCPSWHKSPPGRISKLCWKRNLRRLTNWSSFSAGKELATMSYSQEHDSSRKASNTWQNSRSTWHEKWNMHESFRNRNGIRQFDVA